jgi:hypothetical protein
MTFWLGFDVVQSRPDLAAAAVAHDQRPQDGGHQHVGPIATKKFSPIVKQVFGLTLPQESVQLYNSQCPGSWSASERAFKESILGAIEDGGRLPRRKSTNPPTNSCGREAILPISNCSRN